MFSMLMQYSELQLDLGGKDTWIESSFWAKSAGKLPEGVCVPFEQTLNFKLWSLLYKSAFCLYIFVVSTAIQRICNCRKHLLM